MTKWKIKRLPNVEEKLSFSWAPLEVEESYKWDWEKIEPIIESMEINEERIIEIL